MHLLTFTKNDNHQSLAVALELVVNAYQKETGRKVIGANYSSLGGYKFDILLQSAPIPKITPGVLLCTECHTPLYREFKVIVDVTDPVSAYICNTIGCRNKGMLIVRLRKGE